jgi:outer membrane receptor for ferrienterochelin and colicins
MQQGSFRVGWSGPTLFLLCSAAPLAAQETPATVASVEGSRTYLPVDFARFAPRNALEMVRQVPGFVIQGQSQERGLGQASGNVLINGQRISGKSNDAVAELSRIPASSVVRVEVVDGATLNIAGLSGKVANVIVKSSGISGQFLWRPEIRARNTDPNLTHGNVSVSGSSGRLEYTVGLRNESYRSGHSGPSLIYDPEGKLIDTRDELATYYGDNPKLSGNFRYLAGDSVANLNLGYQRFWYRHNESSDRTGAGQPNRLRTVSTRENEYNYEMGGDYELGLGGGRLKLIGVHQFEHSPIDQVAVTTYADGSSATGSRFFRIGDETETIGRAEYRWKVGSNDWQVSAEAAYNILDNVSSFYLLSAGGDFVEVPLPGASAKVTEDRYEASATWGRAVSPKLSLQASLGAEYSTLSLSGPQGQTRSFYRPKGFLSATWNGTPDLDVNAKLERRVGQLNFFDFLASENLQRNVGSVGNPDLVPPQSWDAEVEFAQRLGPWGRTTARFYTRQISDIVDQIPIGPTGEAPGNLPHAAVFGFESRSTIEFTPIGWRGAKLDARLQLQTSRLDDPLTEEKRRISNDLIRFASLDFRHDVPDTDWAWGGVMNLTRRAPAVRLGEISRARDMAPFITGFFVEHKDLAGLTVRVSINNPNGGDDFFSRTVWAGRRNGDIAYMEDRVRTVGPIVALRISGSV